MSTKREASLTSTAIQQRITSSNHFDGTFPVADSVVGAYGSIYRYPAAAAGGLIFWDSEETLVCDQVHIDLGASGNILLYLVNLDPNSVDAGTPTVLSGESFLIESDTAVQFATLDAANFRVTLLPYQALKLVTTASGAAQIVQAVARQER